MARPKRNATVLAMIRNLKKSSESIWSWSERQPDEIDVLLGPPPNRPPEEACWGASGRSFHFRKIDGRWRLVGEGQWRS